MAINYEKLSGAIVGTSKSGINGYQQKTSDGIRVLTSFKDGKIQKEIVQMPKNTSSISDTYVRNFKTNEETTITKYFDDATGKVRSLFSDTKSLKGSTKNNPILRYVEQIFEDGKLNEFKSFKR